MNLHHRPSAKFQDLHVTAKGERRASVALERLDTLWFETGTLCNIACPSCYIESSPKNDRLSYLTLEDVVPYLDEVVERGLGTRLVGFTGGEPFMNGHLPAILAETLGRGFEVLVLTNAMKPMMRHRAILADLAARHGPKLRVRVSLDDHRPAIHDAERGEGAFASALAGLRWLAQSGVALEVAGRRFSGDPEPQLRAGFADLFRREALPVDADDPQSLVLFPEMEPDADPPEITEACWGILGKAPSDVMCASARMVAKRKGAARPVVLACTLIPYDPRFEMGATLADASRPVPLAHKYCATFCVLGGAGCGASRG
jgi:uncharacterized Fe-S cluster-containing radical SAM superfamily protein